jgi:fatty-acyl-CoA synthase
MVTPSTPYPQRLSSSYWHAESTEPVVETTVGGVLRDAAHQVPDQPALVVAAPGDPTRRRWTYAELLADAEQTAHALLTRFEPGERVAVLAPNIPERVLLQYGAALARLTLVPINPSLRPKELQYVLGQSRASGVFFEAEHRDAPMSAFVYWVRPRMPDLREVVSFSEWQSFLGGTSTGPLPDVRPNDAAQIEYTSGTTGFPKGVLLHHRGITNNARFLAQRLAAQPGETWLNPMPLFHAAAWLINLLGALQTHSTQVLCPFDPALLLALIEHERGGTISLMPTMLITLLEHEDFDRRGLSSLRSVALSGMQVAPDLVRRAEAALGTPIVIGFGMTELCGIATHTRPDDAPHDRAHSVGQPLPHVEVKIVDPHTGEVVPPGTVGEICVRGYLVMTGYFDTPEATAATIDRDGWLRTGDLGLMDERGYTRIEGRLRDVINRGAETIYPREIEDLLNTHPDVAEVAVVGVPDAVYGEEVAAFIRPVRGRSPTPEQLLSFCRGQLAPDRTPRYWVFVDQFPTTPSGKIQKFLLREQFVANG